MIRILRIPDQTMDLGGLQPGDVVIALGLPRQRFKVGDMIVAVHPVQGAIVRVIADMDSSARVLLHGVDYHAGKARSAWLDKSCLWGKVRWRFGLPPLPGIRSPSR